MSDNNTKATKRPFFDDPFPWRCQHCFKDEVHMAIVPYDAEVKYDGRLYTFAIPNMEMPICRACGEKVYTEKVDEQINDALRKHLKLLTTEEIRSALDRLSMTQKEMTERLGIAEATLSRWLNETQIQSRAMDNLMRVFFEFPNVRAALSQASLDPALGTSDPAIA